MAIEAGWDPEAGPPLPCPSWDEEPDEPAFELPDDAELAWWAALDAAAPVGECPWPDDEPVAVEEAAWAVPGVSGDDEPGSGLSAEVQSLLDEAAAAVRAQRIAGGRLYRALTALGRSDVLAQTHYKKLSRLLEDHLHLDAAAVTALEKQAAALHPTVTPSGATSPAELPATSGAVDEGLVDHRHVEIIRKTMERIRTAPGLDPAVSDTAEEQLAGLAAMLSPRRLATAATVIAERLDPDGAAPTDDDPCGNELHYSKRRNGTLSAKLVLRDPAAVALFDEAIRAATPAPASAACADPETGLPPVTGDGRQVGADPRVEARDSKPCRQAYGLLDLLAASHRAGLDHPEHEQQPGSPTASMPLPDLDDHHDTGLDDDLPGNATDPASANDHVPGNGAAADSDADLDADDEPAMFGPAAPHLNDDEVDREAADNAEALDSAGSAGSDDAADPPPEPGPPDLGPPEPPPPWTPPDVGAMTLPGRERVTLSVTLDYDTLRQQLTDTSRTLALLGDSTWIRPETARRLACDAEVIPMVLGSHGEVLEVGRKTRAVPTATARAVIHRDRHCAFPGCRRRARTAEIHHIVHWADLGDTEPDNLVCLCRYHHDLVHHAGWQVTMVDHMPWFTPPAWLDPTRTPRHNRPWQLV